MSTSFLFKQAFFLCLTFSLSTGFPYLHLCVVSYLSVFVKPNMLIYRGEYWNLTLPALCFGGNIDPSDWQAVFSPSYFYHFPLFSICFSLLKARFFTFDREISPPSDWLVYNSLYFSFDLAFYWIDTRLMIFSKLNNLYLPDERINKFQNLWHLILTKLTRCILWSQFCFKK